MTGRPDFLGIGAQKAATTWLFKRLCMHPEIYFPRGKEIHFWDKQASQPNRSLAVYTRIFEGALVDHIGGKTGDITPAYLLIPDALIAQIAEIAPDVRLIAMLRNPVERAISAAAQVHRRRGVVEIKQNPLFSRSTTEAGLYGKHLARWLQHFPREQLLAIPHEEVKTDPLGVLHRTAAHIGVDPKVYDLIDISLLNSPTSPTPNRVEVTDKQMQRLRKTYREDVAALESLLGRSFGWFD